MRTIDMGRQVWCSWFDGERHRTVARLRLDSELPDGAVILPCCPYTITYDEEGLHDTLVAEQR